MSTFNVEQLQKSDDDGPVTMLNLVKYRDRSLDGDSSGREAYERYTQRARNLVESRGGRVLWAGVVAEAALQDGLTGDEVDWTGRYWSTIPTAQPSSTWSRAPSTLPRTSTAPTASPNTPSSPRELSSWSPCRRLSPSSDV